MRQGPVLEPLTVPAAGNSWGDFFSISVIEGRDAWRGRARLGLDEVLAGVPGVSAQNRYTYALDTRLVIRGFGARSSFGVRGVTLILDGVPQTFPDGQGQLTSIDLASADRVEVVRGAAAAFYGNAAGGVMTVESRRPGMLRTAGTRIVTGSFGLVRWSINAGTPLGRSGAGVSLDLGRTRTGGYRAHSAAELRQAAVATVFPIGTNARVIGRVRAADLARAENPGALTDPERRADPTAAAARNVAQDAGKQVRQWQESVELRRWTGRSQAAAIVYGVQRYLDNPLTSAYVTLDRSDWGGRFTGRWSLAADQRLELVAGADAQRMRDRRRNYDNLAGRRGDTLRVAQQEVVASAGARVALSARPFERTGLVAGLRYDRATFRVRDELLADGDATGARAMGAVSVTAGVSQRIVPFFNLHASVGSAFETPTTTELANPGTGGLSDSLGPQRAVQWEVGANVGRAPLRASVTFYESSIRDGLLQYEVPASPGRFGYRNTDRSRHRGAELEVEWTPAIWLRQRAALTMTDARFVSYPTDSIALDGNRVPGVPRTSAYLGWALRPANEVRVFVEWVAAGRTEANDANTAGAAAWQVVNGRASWDVGARGRRHAQAFAGFNNLFDARYSGSLNVNGAANRYFEPSPGRNRFVGLEIEAGR